MSCFGHCGSSKSGSWTKVGPGSTHLYQQVETLYWTGVEEELENIIRTLRSWQREENSGIQIDDETDEIIHGYDTFLGQVSSGQRAFAKRYGDWIEEEAARNIPNQRYNPARYQPMKPPPVANQDQRDSYNEEATKIEVEKSIASIPRLSGLQNRACMLLQAAGFLDIDKLVEHRPPLEDWGFWARPAMPQMEMTGKEECTPKFGPLHCQKAECHRIIRGSMFVKKGESTETICESCYRASPHGRSSFKKVYKHCILPEVITPEISREMCACETVPHDDQNGQERSLFPVEIDEKHTDEEAKRCKLLDLGRSIALAKLHGLEDVVEEQVAEREGQEKLKKTPSKFESFKRRLFPKKETEREEEERHSQTEPDPIENPAVTSEAEADGDIPFFFRQYAQQYPFGNVHMALRVGPLVIENGVPNTKGGALISLREYPVFHDRPNIGDQHRLAIVEDEERYVWEQKQRPEVETRKRYKAVMKQVVGAPFTGLLSSSEDAEQQKRIIELLIDGSQRRFDDAGLPQKDRSSLLRDALKPVMERLKNLLGHRVKIYLSSVVYQLLNEKNSLRWSSTGNNCQTFCNNLIENSLFGSLTTGGGVEGQTSSSPLYLMSFVCPQEGYLRNRVRTKYDVPCGLTEEYLLKFHFGRHDEVDIIDDLQEYWYDWGAFGAPLYKNQDLFPWDCIEAYGRYHTKCNDCNLAKHIWAFPFDSWSMIELHLHRDSQMYPSSDGKWMENRLKVLAAASLLARAATGMVRSKRFRDETEWLSPMSDMSLNKELGLVRVKLGGIHRAQPFSHYFEAGRYYVYFQAEWAIRNRPQQIIEYEALRDQRMKRKELGGGGGGGGGGELSTNNIDPHAAAMLEQQFQSFFGPAMAEIDIPTAGESDAHNQNHDEDANHTERDQDPINSTASTTNSGHDSDATSHVSSQHDETVDDHTDVSTPSAPSHTAGSSSHQPSSRHSGRDDTSDVGSLPSGFNHLHSYNHRSKPSGFSSYHPSSLHDHHSSTNDHHSYSPSYSSASYSSASYSSPSHSSTSYSSPSYSSTSYSSPSYSSTSYSSPSYSSPSYGGTSSSHGHSSTSYGGTSSSYGGSSSRGGGSNSYSNDY